MVDTADSKSANASCGGSSPPAGTTLTQKSQFQASLISQRNLKLKKLIVTAWKF